MCLLSKLFRFTTGVDEKYQSKKPEIKVDMTNGSIFRVNLKSLRESKVVKAQLEASSRDR